MKTCPYCAEKIQDKALICKHCKNKLPQKDLRHKQSSSDDIDLIKTIIRMIKWLGIILLGLFAIGAWQIFIPSIVVWFIWKKTKWNKKKKYIGTALFIVLFSIFVGFYSHINKVPSVVIIEPDDDFTIQSSEIEIKGMVDPQYAILNIDDVIVKTESGAFNYLAKLSDKENTFTIKASNTNGESQQQITINRTFTDEELLEYERRKAKEEAEKQAVLEAKLKADKKAEEARIKQELAEQRKWDRSKAGRLCTKYTTWTKDQCISVADKEYWIGMTYDMLIEAHGGKPNSANPSNYGSGTSWQWCWTYRTPSCFYDRNNDGIIDSYN